MNEKVLLFFIIILGAIVAILSGSLYYVTRPASRNIQQLITATEDHTSRLENLKGTSVEISGVIAALRETTYQQAESLERIQESDKQREAAERKRDTDLANIDQEWKSTVEEINRIFNSVLSGVDEATERSRVVADGFHALEQAAFEANGENRDGLSIEELIAQ